jgi:cAMP-dependent protein kinase regulator
VRAQGEAVGVYEAEDGSAKQVAQMRSGDYFGERALLTLEPRALTVKAVTALKVLSLDAPSFERILGPCKGAMAERIAAYERFGEPDCEAD